MNGSTKIVLGAALLVAILAAVAVMDPSYRNSLKAMEWTCNWEGFCKFWRTQLGRTTGVVGTVAMIVGAGALIICSAKKKT